MSPALSRTCAPDTATVLHWSQHQIMESGNVVCSVSSIRIADTLNTCFTNCLYCKLIVVTDVVLKCFFGLGPTVQLSSHIISLDQTCWHVAISSVLCRVYTKTHVARKHVSRTSNLYPDTYMLTDTCRRIHVVRSGYMLTVSRRHNYYSFMSRSTCFPLYPATDRRATILSPIQETCWRQQMDTSGYNLYPATCILV